MQFILQCVEKIKTLFVVDETTVELRILPEQMDEIAQKWMEYRNAANRR